MKVLYIHQYFKTREGFSSTRSYEFAKRLVDAGHQVTMLTGSSRLTEKEIPISKGKIYQTYNIDGIEVVAIRDRYSNYMGNFRRILTFISFLILSSVVGLRIKKHDIIYATSTPLTIGIPAMFISFVKKTPYIFEVRDLWPEAPIQMGVIKNKTIIKVLRCFEKVIYNRSSHIVTLSPGMTEGVLAHGIPKTKISMIPNSCDNDLFSKVNSDPKIFIDMFDLQDKFVAIHPGSMGVANGLMYIVKAAKYLQDLGNDRVVILLTGDGATKPSLEKYCQANGLKNVIFTGRVPKYKMPNLLAATDITITSFQNIPILATNSPNKFFDSLAAGKPIIVNSSGWTREIVEKKDLGYYVNPEEPRELANLLHSLSKGSKEHLLIKGKNAREIAETKFDRDLLAKKLEKILLDNIR